MKPFFHPGTVLGSRQFAFLQRVKSTTNEVFKKGLKRLTDATPPDYKPQVIKNVSIEAYGKGIGRKEFIDDATQSYYQVLMYVIYNNEAHAKKAVEILTSWSKDCETFTGSNAPLECAWGGTSMVRAAEILKYMYKGWTEDIERQFNAFLDKIIMPNLMNRYNEIFKWTNNWILTIQEARIQIAIFRNDRKTFDFFIEEFSKSRSSCLLDCGMNTETKRDLMHCQFQIGSIVNICEMCFHQGLNLYNDRIRKCMEYHAYIINGNIPKEVKKDELKEVWFMGCSWDVGYNHFFIRMKQDMPHTDKLLTKYRPEKPALCWGPAWIHYEPR